MTTQEKITKRYPHSPVKTVKIEKIITDINPNFYIVLYGTQDTPTKRKVMFAPASKTNQNMANQKHKTAATKIQ